MDDDYLVFPYKYALAGVLHLLSLQVVERHVGIVVAPVAVRYADFFSFF